MDDKVIVTNRSSLAGKYGADGFAKVRAGIDALIAADAKRGIKSKLVYLDDAAAMKKIGAKAVLGSADARGAKAAIDRIFTALQPDYLLIIGASDVVPHQDLNNPVYSATDDDDQLAPGDLPYACETPYARDPAKFIGPTRIVGRLPDLVKAKKPTYLLSVLRTAAKWRSRPASEYATYFGLSAEEWKGSTRLSLDSIFGNADRLVLAPPKGPKHAPAELRAGLHFINCHGAMATPEFYGQRGTKYPKSLTTTTIANTISEGTVAAVECCYGGELYDSETLETDVPICQSYLRQGAYGYFGSTTIAYGPAETNGAADLICQYFLLNVLDGASLGRAALMARQQFVERTGQMDPVDLKTIAQFCLYGDPSVHPVSNPAPATAPKGVAKGEAERFFRGDLRAKLKLKGEFLQTTKPTASKPRRNGRIPPKTKTVLSKIAKEGGLPAGQTFVAFGVKDGKPPKGMNAKAATAPSQYYVTVGIPTGKTRAPVSRGVAVVAKAVGGRVVGYRIYHQH